MSETAAEEGIRLVVRVTPKSGRDAVAGVARDESGKPVLKARIAAAPEDGKANASLVALLATEFDVPKRAVTILRGQHTRLKQVHIRGDGAMLSARLRRIGESW